MTRTCSQRQEQVRPRTFVAQGFPGEAVVAVLPAPGPLRTGFDAITLRTVRHRPAAMYEPHDNRAS
jgi:hypothetical protein